ncbi:MAG: ribonuclease HI [Sulfurospirillaceae bacterium]|nr:ribonuclease HI [Sulfurospirillaceae bacterium]
MKKISLFCDGSSLGNPGEGGYCAILRYGQSEKIVSGGQKNATNNQMELLAVIKGLEALKEPCDVSIVSDSSYVVKGINEWLANWVKKNFAKVKNPELWRDYIEVSRKHKVHAIWVRGHDGHEENERCDKIAKEEAIKLKE